MNMQEFSAEFGPCETWPYPTRKCDVVTVMNQKRTEAGLPPLLDGRMTTWGWFKSGGGPTVTDWKARAEALRLSLELFKVAQSVDLRLCSTPYTPLAAHLGTHGDFLDRLKTGLGIDVEAPAEVGEDLFDGDLPAEQAAACQKMVELLAPYTPCRVRFDVGPVLVIGQVGHHVAGLWTCEIRS